MVFEVVMVVVFPPIVVVLDLEDDLEPPALPVGLDPLAPGKPPILLALPPIFMEDISLLTLVEAIGPRTGPPTVGSLPSSVSVIASDSSYSWS